MNITFIIIKIIKYQLPIFSIISLNFLYFSAVCLPNNLLIIFKLEEKYNLCNQIKIRILMWTKIRKLKIIS